MAITYSELSEIRPTFKNLCKTANDLGYKDPFHQLMLENGSSVGDLIDFFEDNPGALDAVFKWIRNQKWDACDYAEDIDDEQDEE